MSDVLCSLCGEPWDIGYVRHEMHTLDRNRFQRGRGCETCDFGASCPSCAGTGRQAVERHDLPEQHCALCLGSRYLIVRQAVEVDECASWQTGHIPNVQEIKNPDILFRYRDETYLEGRFRIVKAHCPDCRDTAPPCRVCAGSGKLQPGEQDLLEAAASELATSDEDPARILARRGLL